MMKSTTLITLLEGRPLLRCKDLERHYGVSRWTIYRWIKTSSFPKPIYIHGPMWRPKDIEHYDQGRITAARA